METTESTCIPEDTESRDLFDCAAHADEIRAVLDRRAGAYNKRPLFLALRSCEHLHQRLTDESERAAEGELDTDTLRDLSCHVSELYTLVADEATALDDEELFVAARSLDHLNTRLTELVSESR